MIAIVVLTQMVRADCNKAGVAALSIEEIKSAYMDQLAEWTGDPCVPYPHPWVTCSIVDVTVTNPSILAV